MCCLTSWFTVFISLFPVLAGEVIVALANDGGFQVFTQEGKLLRRINLQQTGALGEDAHAFFVPEAIAVDSEDNIFATDSNSNSLTIFSPEGNFLAQLGKPSLRNPFGVALDRLGRVVASDSSDQVKIFWAWDRTWPPVQRGNMSNH